MFTLLRLDLVGVSIPMGTYCLGFVCLFIISSLGLCASVGLMLLFLYGDYLIAASGAHPILALALFLAILFLI